MKTSVWVVTILLMATLVPRGNAQVSALQPWSDSDAQRELLFAAVDTEIQALSGERRLLPSSDTARSGRISQDEALMGALRKNLVGRSEDTRPTLPDSTPILDRYLHDFGVQQLRDEFPGKLIQQWEVLNQHFLRQPTLAARDEALAARDATLEEIKRLIPIRQMVTAVRAGPLPVPARNNYLELVGGPREKTPRPGRLGSSSASLFALFGLSASGDLSALFGQRPTQPGGNPLGGLFGNEPGPNLAGLPTLPAGLPRSLTPIQPGGLSGASLPTPGGTPPTSQLAASPATASLPRLDGVERALIEIPALDQLMAQLPQLFGSPEKPSPEKK